MRCYCGSFVCFFFFQAEDGIRDRNVTGVRRVLFRSRAAIPMYSTVTGKIVDGRDLSAQYWVNNLREPVLFLTAIQALLEDDYDIFLEMSPHPILRSEERRVGKEGRYGSLCDLGEKKW